MRFSAQRHNPLISIIIPVANRAEPRLLKKTLDSISKQTYKNFEIVAIIGDNANPALIKTLKQYPKIRIIKKTLGKSDAQNYGVGRARGKYLLMHDVATVLVPSALEKMLNFSINNKHPLSLPRRFESSNNYWILCRNFDFALYDKVPEASYPLFLEKNLFLKIGGYDSQFEPLDDWSLLIKLKNMKIPISSLKEPVCITYTTINFLKIARQKYLRGQAFGLINRLYPEILSKNFSSIFEVYKENIPLLLSNLHLLPGLFIIKLFNIVPLYLGILSCNTSRLNYYESKTIAEKFEKKGLDTNYGFYKHFCETTSLKNLLPRKKSVILEIGAGTGRITKILISKGFKVIPVEPSEAMLKFYRKKNLLPDPIKISGENLSFKNRRFSLVISIRVLWHVRDKAMQERFIKEICRVCSNEIVLDITNKNRYKNPLLRIPARLCAFVFKIPFNFEQTYLFDIFEFGKLIKKQGFEISEKIPLEVTTPFWLNLLGKKKARKIFPWLYQLDIKLSPFIAPGRFMLRLTRKIT